MPQARPPMSPRKRPLLPARRARAHPPRRARAHPRPPPRPLPHPPRPPPPVSSRSGLADTLNGALSSLKIERDTQLVFFHPEYMFRDGKQRNGVGAEGAAANYARRSPYPMINLLRTPQVRARHRAARGGRSVAGRAGAGAVWPSAGRRLARASGHDATCARHPVRAAQKGIPTGSVYDLNEKNLDAVGAAELQSMLESKDWDALKGMQFEKHNSDTWTL
eukprot:5669590-Prymnesium_polylepis.1